ncbi:Granule-bound starch synthase 1, chloroplastic/amyloplastic [Gossypium arboreum]|uniref:Granule-bound starch synthase 1, chloroplastic/amyloplastic n=1 Tax=Gossypium arboreum TaxID=29729 RepID=A0A0B0MEH9_GOSAR|nr:Granule-bound starch synthase 1, chloroplastic/amyloplastic [Gossypium arboreum]
MATVTASHLVSTVCQVNSHGADTKAANLICMKNQAAITHNGLRFLNMLDRLQMRTNAKAVARQAVKQENPRPWGKIICGKGLNLVFVGAECGPWSKTGGLGDVLGGLPPAMAANGHRVMTVSPRYDQYMDAWDTSVLVEVKVGDKIETVRFFHCYKRGVDRVFVDHPMFLEKVWGKTGSKIYGPNAGVDYKDNQLRFSLLCQAALEAPKVLNLNTNRYFSGPYGEDVIFIANDWHTGLLPCYLKSMYQSRDIYMNAKVAFCIHNIAYQGRFPFSDFSVLNLPDRFKSSFDFFDGYPKPIKGRKINWMKAGILESDKVLTVSPYYAQELISGEDKGVELDNIIRKTGITGIVNGMDVQEWNPATDQHINVQYDASTGTGKKAMEEQIENLETQYPDKARGIANFNVPLAHKIIAGSDFILIPSRFEPCGLIQLHAMRYGTVPIVASTGGLVDTVKEGFTGFQMGAFNVECDAVDPSDLDKVAKTVKKALATYGTPTMNEMIQNCMAQDLSWKGPSKLWEKLLLSLEVAGSEPGNEGEEIAPFAKENVATP